MEEISIKNEINGVRLEEMMKEITFRGLYDEYGQNIKPYENAKFKMAVINPPRSIYDSPKIIVNGEEKTLFTSQPTIYENQTDIIRQVDTHFKKKKIKINELDKAIEYDWQEKGEYHILPPIVEKHTYHLTDGFFNLEKICERLNGKYIKDAKENMHDMSKRYLNSFYIDEISKIDHLDIFNSNAPIINYGLKYTGEFDFYIICDGSHRIDYSIEELAEPISVILVEPMEKEKLIPYYAFPVSFKPTIRLSSKKSEKIYHRLERDKIHFLNDFIKKILHYNWEDAGLKVGKLRSNTDIY